MQSMYYTVNELINAMVTKGGDSCRKLMWDIVDEMKTADVKPNQVTISILLKNLNSWSGQVDIAKKMDYISAPLFSGRSLCAHREARLVGITCWIYSMQSILCMRKQFFFKLIRLEKERADTSTTLLSA